MGRLAPPEPMPPEAAGLLEAAADRMGFVPNSLRAMAHRPHVLRSVLELGVAVMAAAGTASPALRQMVAYVASLAGGCRYCQAHTAHQAHRLGLAPEKLGALWSFEESPLFSEAERAALRLAMLAGQTPNGAEQGDVAAVRSHFGEEGLAEIVAVIAFFGFLNRWNDTLAMPLEDAPLVFGQAQLQSSGWRAGKHAG